MKKLKYIVGGLIIVVILLALFTKSSSPTIGVVIPLSGKSASFGERVQRGVELAAAETGITPIFEDDKGEAPTVVTIVNKLITIDKVKVIIGTVKSDAMLAVAPITEKNKIILFSPTAGAAQISQVGDFVFRNIETPTIHGAQDAEFFKNHNIKTVAVFTANASNAQGYGNAFMENFRVIASTTYNQDDTDFRTIITKSLSLKPEGIFIGVATAKDAGLLVKQIHELGFKGLIMTSVAADAKEFFDTAGAYAENTYVSTSFFDPTIEPSLSYNNKYKAKYGVDSDAFSANAYDATILLSLALKNCKTNTECIRDYLYNTQDYLGVSGLTTFDKNGDVIKPVAIKVAKGGKFELVK